mmetsp:Transcript_82854/g.239363  ORF Transcript_82854/g.239363 Transcript_82854/m.239363 type:complete len:275 (+) Transcript_82854:809-1633(+)
MSLSSRCATRKRHPPSPRVAARNHSPRRSPRGPLSKTPPRRFQLQRRPRLWRPRGIHLRLRWADRPVTHLRRFERLKPLCGARASGRSTARSTTSFGTDRLATRPNRRLSATPPERNWSASSARLSGHGRRSRFASAARASRRARRPRQLPHQPAGCVQRHAGTFPEACRLWHRARGSPRPRRRRQLLRPGPRRPDHGPPRQLHPPHLQRCSLSHVCVVPQVGRSTFASSSPSWKRSRRCWRCQGLQDQRHSRRGPCRTHCQRWRCLSRRRSHN